jgi:hypothetical protein
MNWTFEMAWVLPTFSESFRVAFPKDQMGWEGMTLTGTFPKVE